MIYGRRSRQLLVVWGVAILLAALVFWLEFSAPALHDLVVPVYWIIGAVAVFLTWRWLRSRSKKDRRNGDRRRASRRDVNDSTSS
jgi:membrane protein implicated in regulation of membrane protease activity